MIKLPLHVALATALLLCTAPSASADSIAFIKDDNVWLAAPDGSQQAQLTTEGDYWRAVQSDDGTVMAIRNGGILPRVRGQVVHMDRTGRPLHVISPPEGWSLTNVEVSPDGRHVVYGRFSSKNGASEALFECALPGACGSLGSPWTDYGTGAWVDNTRIAAFADGGARILSLDGTAVNWSLGDPPQTAYDDGDVSRDGTKVVTLIADEHAPKLRFYTLAGAPPAAPTARCDVPIKPHYANTIAFSPAGDAVVYAQPDGIHVLRIDVTTCQTDGGRLLIAGADRPDWSGPAPSTPPAPDPGPTPTPIPTPTPAPPEATVTFGGATKATLARGYRLTASCSQRCTVTARLTLRRAGARRLRLGNKDVVVARGQATGGPGKVKVTLRFTVKAKHGLRRARGVRLQLSANAGGTTTRRTIRLAA